MPGAAGPVMSQGAQAFCLSYPAVPLPSTRWALLCDLPLSSATAAACMSLPGYARPCAAALRSSSPIGKEKCGRARTHRTRPHEGLLSGRGALTRQLTARYSYSGWVRRDFKDRQLLYIIAKNMPVSSNNSTGIAVAKPKSPKLLSHNSFRKTPSDASAQKSPSYLGRANPAATQFHPVTRYHVIFTIWLGEV